MAAQHTVAGANSPPISTMSFLSTSQFKSDTRKSSQQFGYFFASTQSMNAQPPDNGRHLTATVNERSSTVRQEGPLTLIRQRFSSSENHSGQVIKPRHKCEVPFILLDSDSEAENKSEPKRENAPSVNAKPTQFGKTSNYEVTNSKKTCEVSKDKHKYLLNYSIPVSDSDSETEENKQINQVNDQCSVKMRNILNPSKKISREQDETINEVHNSSAENRTNQDPNCELASQVLTQEGSCKNVEIEETCNNHNKSKGTTKNSNGLSSFERTVEQPAKTAQSVGKKSTKHKKTKSTTNSKLFVNNKLGSYISEIDHTLKIAATTEVDDASSNHKKRKGITKTKVATTSNDDNKQCKENPTAKHEKMSKLVEVNGISCNQKNTQTKKKSINLSKNDCKMSPLKHTKKSPLKMSETITRKIKKYRENTNSVNNEISEEGCAKVKKKLIESLIMETEKSFAEQKTSSVKKRKKYKDKKRKQQINVANENEPDNISLRNKTENYQPEFCVTDQVLSSKGDSCGRDERGSPANPPVVDLVSQDETHSKEDLFSPVVSELVCVSCRSLTSLQHLRSCECKLICDECCRSTEVCADCSLMFKTPGRRFSGLYMRLCEQIGRPCLYRSVGCPSVVVPGDNHESTCQFRPFLCPKCNMEIPKIHCRQHFNNEHALAGRNHDVKLKDFQMNSESGKLEVCCFTSRKHCVYLILNKSEEGENAQFIVNSNTDVTVKLLFSQKNSVFRYECDNRTNNDDLEGSGLSFVDVPKEAINYWFKDKCVLDIYVRKRVKKRKGENESFNILEHNLNYKKRKLIDDNCIEEKKA